MEAPMEAQSPETSLSERVRGLPEHDRRYLLAYLCGRCPELVREWMDERVPVKEAS